MKKLRAMLILHLPLSKWQFFSLFKVHSPFSWVLRFRFEMTLLLFWCNVRKGKHFNARCLRLNSSMTTSKYRLSPTLNPLATFPLLSPRVLFFTACCLGSNVFSADREKRKKERKTDDTDQQRREQRRRAPLSVQVKATLAALAL